MNQQELELDLFRLHIQLNIVQECALRAVLLASYQNSNVGAAETLQDLKQKIALNSQTADESYGALTRDPALTAVYADEVFAITKSMTAMLDLIAHQLSGGKIGKAS